MMFISSDGHVTAPMEDYREYLPTRYHDDFTAYLHQYDLFNERMHASFIGGRNERRTRIWMDHQEALDETGARAAQWDPHRRVEVMEAEGVVAEVVFPDGGPFDIRSFGIPHIEDYGPELLAAGAKAYNRWLADFCSTYPDRFAGQAVIWFHDVGSALEEIRWAREAGLRGVIVPGVSEHLPLHYEPVYEPVWALCAELELPINFHGGSGLPRYRAEGLGEFSPPSVRPDVGAAVMKYEFPFFARRPLWFLLLSGVLERHPGLKLVFTEHYSGWVPMTLAAMDYNWEYGGAAERIRDLVPRRPSEYWAEQCYIGASVASRAEFEHRADIGVDKMMFGVDFPHPESSWGGRPDLTGRVTLQATLGAAGATDSEARAIIGENAARVFGFDPKALAPIAERVGPTREEVLTPMFDPPTPEIEDKFIRSEVLRPMGR